MSEANFDDKSEELVVFIIRKEAICGECGAEIGRGGFLRSENGKPLCMDCADLGELIFLPSGNTALTRRAKKNSNLTAVVLKFSRTRGRYERQGLLVEEEGLAKAELECATDDEARARARAGLRRSART